MDPLTALQNVPLFRHIPAQELLTLAGKVRSVEHKKGTVVISQAEPGTDLYLIQAGTVKVVLPAGDKELILALMGEGEFFGEMSLLDGQPRSATVTVQTMATLLVLQRDDFLAWLEERPQICMRLLAQISVRLRESHRRYSSLASLDSAGRIVHVLREMADKDGDRLPEGLWIRRLPNQSEIAGLAGTSRETVSRTIGDLTKQGLVRPKGKGLLLIDVDLAEA